MTCPHIDLYTKVLGEFVPVSCPYCATDAQHRQETESSAVIEACWFCEGACKCDFPSGTDPIDTSGFPGFETNDMWITCPNMSECMRFYVDPIKAYGTPFVQWAQQQPAILARISDEKRRALARWNCETTVVDIVIRLHVQGTPADVKQHHEALGMLANVMAAQALDGLWSAGYRDGGTEEDPSKFIAEIRRSYERAIRIAAEEP